MPKKPSIQLQFNDIRPSLITARTKATFQPSTTLWSDTVVTWSDISAYWAGADRVQAKGPVLFKVGLPTQFLGSGTAQISAGQSMGPGFFMFITY